LLRRGCGLVGFLAGIVGVTAVALGFPVGIAARDDIDLARPVEAEREVTVRSRKSRSWLTIRTVPS
jgi:hypothetical protein